MSKSILSPEGFEKPPASPLEKPGKVQQNTTGNDPHENLKVKKAWETAWAPAKNIPMNAFMLWMAGSGVQIFSIMITVMLLYQPLKAILNVKSVFEPYTSTSTKSRNSLFLPMALFVAVNLCIFALGVWKCSTMGLLPTASSDWLSVLPPKHQMENAIFPKY